MLVDSEHLANDVLAGLLTDAGWPTTPEACMAEFVGSSLERVRAIVEARLGRPLPAELEDRYHNDLFARYAVDLRAVPGVAEALAVVGAATTVCVASSGTPERIARSLAVTGLAGVFGDRTFSASDPAVAAGKPAPDLFLHAAATLGARPDRCVVVEDSPLGVTAARAAGMAVVGYAGLTPARRLAGADVVITTMADLPAALGLPGQR